ncbi:hypothetical protein BC826DRAFT_518796 [Russula brevipes]|nr:hypothetical protein BC826DRAFT_518796 [Russula brevipes]
MRECGFFEVICLLFPGAVSGYHVGKVIVGACGVLFVERLLPRFIDCRKSDEVFHFGCVCIWLVIKEGVSTDECEAIRAYLCESKSNTPRYADRWSGERCHANDMLTYPLPLLCQRCQFTFRMHFKNPRIGSVNTVIWPHPQGACCCRTT